MSNQTITENNNQHDPKTKRGSKTLVIAKACLGISIGIIGISITAAIANLAKEQLLRNASQSINTYTAFKNGKIDYQAFEYISEGRGETPSSIESLMLMGVQREKGDFSGRDRTLMKTLKGDNSYEMQLVLESAREIYDQQYRNDENAINKKLISEERYNKMTALQKTTLNEEELNALKICSEKLIDKQSEINIFLELLIPKKQQCPEAAEIATKFLDNQKEGNNNSPLRQLE